MSPANIGFWQLALATGFVAVSGVVSMVYRLGLGRDLVVGTIRTFAQLFALGYALTLIFKADSALLTLAVFVVSIAMAVWTIRGRVREKTVRFEIPAFFSMLVSYGLVTWVVTGVVVRADTWWTPQYFIPMAGMIAGNSMSAIAIALERLFADLKTRRNEVEAMLSLGASPVEATRGMMRDAMRSGMIPAINSMMSVGIVFIPGMMTGQILSGTDPMLAVRYQIVVMLMLTASTALGAFLVLRLSLARCFGAGMGLVLPREG